LWDLKEPVKAIDTAAYDVVVLQDEIPETTIADFRERSMLAQGCSWHGPTAASSVPDKLLAGYAWVGLHR
jgi:hypothetical protein